MTLSMPATLQDGLDMQEIANSNEYVEVDGDHKCVMLWHEHEDGSRSLTDLYYWE